MSSQLSGGYDSESVIPFAPAAKNAAPLDSADQLDKAGHTILRLLHKAAGVAEANSKHALDMAQKLSHQLRSAEDRIAELEAEVGIYQEKADRAEQWLHKVYTEIEDRFLRQEDSRRSVNGAPKRPAGRGA
jgi:outer membrane PBP1 activator LpoA protein